MDYLLANTTLKVVIYNGQLDLICDTVGKNVCIAVDETLEIERGHLQVLKCG